MSYLERAREVPEPPTSATGEAPHHHPAVSSDVARFLAARCCRSPKVWCEADRLHASYLAAGGRLSQASFLAAVLAEGLASLGPAGLVAGVGMLGDWPPLDGGTLAQRRGEGHAR